MVGEVLGWLGRSWDNWGGVGMVGEELGWVLEVGWLLEELGWLLEELGWLLEELGWLGRS